MQTEVERLAALLDKMNLRDTHDRAEYLIAHGVTLPPAPVDPAWMDAAVEVVTTATEDRGVSRAALRELLAAGYRVIPPTQDRAAVIEAAAKVYAPAYSVFDDANPTHDPGRMRALAALYDAHMLVEGDGR